MSFSFWGRVERGEKPLTNGITLEAMAGALRVHLTELTGQSWTPQDPAGADAQAALLAIETALECYELGADPGLTVRAWPQIQADLDRLVTITYAIGSRGDGWAGVSASDVYYSLRDGEIRALAKGAA